jgi:hypothetical protein
VAGCAKADPLKVGGDQGSDIDGAGHIEDADEEEAGIMTSEENRRDFEQLGVTDLRKRLDMGIYNGRKPIEAEEWLDEKANGANRALLREQTAILERQATAAEKATRIAIGALGISFVAAILSIIAMVRH